MRILVVLSILFISLQSLGQNRVAYDEKVFPKDIHLKPLVFRGMRSAYPKFYSHNWVKAIQRFIKQQKEERGVKHILIGQNRVIPNEADYGYIVNHSESSYTTGNIEFQKSVPSLAFYFTDIRTREEYCPYGRHRGRVKKDDPCLEGGNTSVNKFFEVLTERLESLDSDGVEKTEQRSEMAAIRGALLVGTVVATVVGIVVLMNILGNL